jgi:hypothetical protein
MVLDELDYRTALFRASMASSNAEYWNEAPLQVYLDQGVQSPPTF